ncbi:TIM barrel protein [Thermotoga sp. KOL6]|uniref:TIM barrel protein n=1 Tax=Thermotoga sp. KOL6 TaxID=126741 RepID=UPI000C7740A0|nr:TIM barrel protein [Thermotoga sp. KOL6]PLV59154.1 xylose isomerase [Thermotoga sp. KOL6]
MIKGIGTNVDTRRVNGSIKRLVSELEFFKSIGFDYVEIPAAGLDVIARGRIIRKRLERVKELLSNYNFRYTVHAPDVINLKIKTNPWHYKVMEATIEFAGEIKAEVVVYHYGDVDHSIDIPERLQRKAEINALGELAEFAREKNVVIGIENVTHSVSEVLELVKTVNHPNVKLVIDVGHLFIFTSYTGINFYGELKKGLPHAVELHLSDNFGESPQTYQKIPDIEAFRFVYGIGDLHLPIGEGDIPYNKVLKIIRESGFDGIVILEINSMDRFADEYADSLNLLRKRLILNSNRKRKNRSR